MNKALNIADVLVIALSDPQRDWPLAIVASRAYRAIWELSKLPEEVKVTIMPRKEQRDRVMRKGDDFDYTIRVLVQKKLALATPSEDPQEQEDQITAACDVCTNLVTKIGDYLADPETDLSEYINIVNPQLGDFSFISDTTVAFDDAELNNNLLFASARDITYRVFA
jgi:hypothetical protein